MYKGIILRRDAYATKKTARRLDTYVGGLRYVDGAAYTRLGVCLSRWDGCCGVLYLVFLTFETPFSDILNIGRQDAAPTRKFRTNHVGAAFCRPLN